MLEYKEILSVNQISAQVKLTEVWKAINVLNYKSDYVTEENKLI